MERYIERIKTKKDKYKELIKEYSNNIWTPELNGTKDITPLVFEDIIQQNQVPNENKVRTENYTLIHTKSQKQILLSWMRQTTTIYNVIIEFFSPKIKLYCDLLKENKSRFTIQREKNKELKTLKLELENIPRSKSYNTQRNLKKQEIQVFINELNIFKIQSDKLRDELEETKKNLKLCLSWRSIRDFDEIKEFKLELIKESSEQKNSRIRSHILDDAIKYACSNIKSSLTNLNSGRIKEFKIKSQGYKRNYRVIEVEKQNYNKKGFLFESLGELKLLYNKQEVTGLELDCTCFIRYNKKKDQFVFHAMRSWREKERVENTYRVISIDPGIKTPLTCLTENDCIDLGVDLVQKLRKLIYKRDFALSKDLSRRKKRKLRERINRKIKNIVDDFHWKTSRNIALSCDNVLFDDMSVKSIVRKGGVLTALDKKVALSLRFFQLKQRLKYKCEEQGKSMTIIDEFCTSKMCSRCGWENQNLGGKRIFECQECNLVIDRDLNGARGIFIKSFDTNNFK
jgi:putative transposase